MSWHRTARRCWTGLACGRGRLRSTSRRTVRLDLVRAMRSQIVELGMASAAELDELDAAARDHLEDPRTVVMSGLLFLVWGRKPA